MTTPDEKKHEVNEQQDNLAEPTLRLTRPDESHSESMSSSSGAKPAKKKEEIQWITEEPVAKEEQKTEEVAAQPPVFEQPPDKSKPVEQEAEPKKEKAAERELSEEAAGSSAHPPHTTKDDNGFVFYKCRFCGLTYNFLTTLKAHERVHDVETPYQCTKCGESFHFACELEFHAKSHLKQKGYKCECGRTFYKYTDLLYHTHPGEDEPQHALPEPTPVRRAFSRPAIDPSEFPVPEYAEKGTEPKHSPRVFSDIRSKAYQYANIVARATLTVGDQLAYHMSGHRGERMFNPRASRYLMARHENSYISPGADFKPTYI
ncbi:hypothetical protein M3Y99_00042600 [Aphelenchoides fujianensis]|nr:hypothetical protein M3Y99_00042600 [Aphelenchoides fujianensis]